MPKKLLAILPALALLAQQPATIHGVLTDPTGAVIPAATVALSGMNIQKSIQTAADGSYSFPGLAGGDYALKVDYPGLEGFEVHVTTEPGQTLQVPIQLKLRVASQEVTVTEDRGPEVSTDPSQSAGATVVKDSDLDALPDNPDDLMDMLQALAGPGASAMGGIQILLDGFTGGQLPPKNTIKEIKINQNRFSAANQWAWGGQVEIITKPGADTFHGSLGLIDSDAAFNSRNPYATNKADYVNRMFTTSVGDSIKNRASYMFNFYQNTINNTALIDAVTLAPITLAETPVRSTVVIPRDDISGTGRLDYQISANHTFTGSYRYLQSNRDNNGVGQYSLESLGYPSKMTTSEVHLKETAVLNSGAVTDTMFGYTRNGTFQYGETSTPEVTVSAAFNGGSAQTGRTSDVNSLFEVQSNTTVVHHAHTIQFGGRLRYNAITDISPSNFGGTFSFFGVTDAPVLDANSQPVGNETTQISSLEQYRRTLLFESLGYPSGLIRNLGGGASQFSIAAGNPLVSFSQTDLGVYINDDWRARPNLTVSLGLRYETQTNIHVGKDFAPRAALAWSPGAKNSAPSKTVFRVGWGTFYGRVNPFLTQQALRFNGTTEQQYIVQNPDFYPALPSIGSLAGGQSLTSYRLGPQMQATAVLFTEATVERQLPGKTTVSLSYVDQRTNHIVQIVNINAPLPGTYAAGRPIYPYGPDAGNMFHYESGGIQKYEFMSVHVNSKPNQKISLSAEYSLQNGHNDADWNNLGTAPSNPYNFAADWARVGWAGPNYLNVIGTLIAPGGIEFSPFLVAQSGMPYNLTIGSDLNGDTAANDRPAFATDLARPSVVFTKFGAFDTNPLPGQTIVPRNYLTGSPMWLINLRVSKTFGFGKPKDAPPGGYQGPAQHRYGLNFNIDVHNILNHLNQGGYVGSLSSPLFGQATAMNNGFRDTSNNRKVQFGTLFTF